MFEFDRPSMAIEASRGRCSPLAHAIAFPLGRDYARVMRQAIEQRRRELLVAGKHGDPFGKCEIGRHDGRSTFVAIGDQIKEQLAADPVERHESDLVHDEHIDAQQSKT